MNDPTTNERHSRWQRHLNSVMLGVITAGVGWSLSLLSQIPVIREHIGQIDVQVSGMYSARDARHDVLLIKDEINKNTEHNADQDKRFDINGKRIDRIEHTLKKRGWQ